MKKIVLFFLLLLSRFTVECQIFDFSKKKDYQAIENSFDTLDFINYIQNHPRAKKYTPAVNDRLSCLRIKYTFQNVALSKDTNQLISFINRYSDSQLQPTCLQLTHNIQSDVDEARKILEDLRINTKWEKIVNKKVSYDFVNDTTVPLVRISEFQNFIIQNSNANPTLVLQAKDSINWLYDEMDWASAYKLFTKESLLNYKTSNPERNHKYINLCNELIKEIEDWESCLASNSHSMYVEFKNQHPMSFFVTSGKVNDKLKAIEQKDWNAIQKSKLVNKFDNFMVKYKDGYYFQEAAEKIANLLENASISETKLFKSFSEYLVLSGRRDPTHSKVKIKNNSDRILKMQFTGTKHIVHIINPYDEVSFEIANGSYYYIFSVPYDISVTPLKGKQEFLGYSDYEAALKINITYRYGF